MINETSFEMGYLCCTGDVSERMEKDSEFFCFVCDSIGKHRIGCWGELSEADKKENDFALENGFRLLSSYSYKSGKIWIITEADRSATTVLFPEEY